MAIEEEPKLRPESESIWYALATIAGEPILSGNTISKKNRYYWNGFMRTFLTDEEYNNLEDEVGRKVVLPELSNADLIHIESVLNERGFEGDTYSDPKQMINFTCIKFSKRVDFTGYVFIGFTSFAFAVFTNHTVFRDVIFIEEVHFQQVTFKFITTFNAAIFCKDSNFIEVKFVSDGFFEGVMFRGGALFSKTIFSEYIDFSMVKIVGIASFSEVKFLGLVDFSRSSFLGFPDFHNTVFIAAVNFSNTYFYSDPPAFFDAIVSEAVSWDRAKFSDPANLNIEDATDHINAYERLALMMSKLEKHHDRHMFWQHEMRARRQLDTGWKKLPAKAMNWIFDKACDYGYGFGRALAWWFGHIFAGGVLIFSFTNHSLANLVNSLAASFSNAHSFLGLNRGPLKKVYEGYAAEGWFNALWAVQGLFGIMFLFFLILTIRNRFKMG